MVCKISFKCEQLAWHIIPLTMSGAGWLQTTSSFLTWWSVLRIVIVLLQSRRRQRDMFFFFLKLEISDTNGNKMIAVINVLAEVERDLAVA